MVGAVVALAEKLGKRLDQLTLAELRSVSPKFDSRARDVFDLGKAMKRRAVIGAPGTKEMARQLARWRKQLA
jgi:argininosuccinate lyase